MSKPFTESCAAQDQEKSRKIDLIDDIRYLYGMGDAGFAPETEWIAGPFINPIRYGALQ